MYLAWRTLQISSFQEKVLTFTVFINHLSGNSTPLKFTSRSLTLQKRSKKLLCTFQEMREMPQMGNREKKSPFINQFPDKEHLSAKWDQKLSSQ